eukprot:TRINITY_DN7521_c0_g1_i1.p1 TRINITY_DN7521_c0_g1~~TRINITY_DN7521_c0_g1_i1.p1  ORF type:complete len:1013 (-),score=145.38 TRINITY_DN7521_c0_g1_i1:1-2703(-)
MQALEFGKRVWNHHVASPARISDQVSSNYVDSAVLNMYAKCRNAPEALKIFDSVIRKKMNNAIVWTEMINVLCEAGNFETAEKLIQELSLRKYFNTPMIYTRLTQICANHKSLQLAELVNQKISEKSVKLDASLMNSLIRMYGICDGLPRAIKTFGELQKLVKPNTVTWNTLISLCSETLDTDQALKFLEEMKAAGVSPNYITYLPLFTMCGHSGNLNAGEKIIKELRDSEQYEILGNKKIVSAIMSMYGRCGDFGNCQAWLRAAEDDVKHDVVLWNTLLGFLNSPSSFTEAKRVWEEMLHQRIKPNAVTFVLLLTIAANSREVDFGESVFQKMYESPIEWFMTDVNLFGSVLNMFGKCYGFPRARALFSEFCRKKKLTIVNWNVMFGICQERGLLYEGRELFYDLKRAGVQPDAVTFTHLFTIAANARDSLFAQTALHEFKKFDQSFESLALIGSLLNMVGKCESFDKAWDLFLEFKNRRQPDVKLYNVLLGVCNERELLADAGKVWGDMVSTGISEDEVTYITLFGVASVTKSLEFGKRVEMSLKHHGKDLRTAKVLSSALHMFYMTDKASRAFSHFSELRKDPHLRSVFQKCPTLWNTILSVFSNENRLHDVERLLAEMTTEGVEFDEVTYITLFTLSANLKDRQLGEAILEKFNKSELRHSLQTNDAILGSVLKMYGKCYGYSRVSEFFLETIKTKKVSSYNWSIMLGICHDSQQYASARHLFSKMIKYRVEFRETTYISLFTICANEKNLSFGEELYHHFLKSHFVHSLTEYPVLFGSILNMFGKCDGFKRALTVFQEYQKPHTIPNIGVLDVLLSLCRENNHTSEARDIFNQIREKGVPMSKVTFITLFVICANSKDQEFSNLVYEEFERFPNRSELERSASVWKRRGFVAESE